MSDQWHKGVLAESSWHGKEDIGVMPDAKAMLKAGIKSLAWPTVVAEAEMYAVPTSGVKRQKYQVPGKAMIAGYDDGTARCLSAVGNRYTANTPKDWASLIEAACDAGAKPTGAFSLKGGTRVLATFGIGGEESGISNQLLLCDSFDGSLKLTAGTTSIRVVCANTLHLSLRQDGAEMAGLKHTQSLSSKVETLAGAIKSAIEEGNSVRETYERACDLKLGLKDAQEIVEQVFPTTRDGEKLTGKALKRAENRQLEVFRSMRFVENNVGENLASVWNALTWVVDRDGDGRARKTRGETDRLDSLLFGTRGKLVQTIEKVIYAYTNDGRLEQVRVQEQVEVPNPAAFASQGPVFVGSDKVPGEE